MFKKLMSSGELIAIRRISDGAIIPPVEDNSDYMQFLEWLAEPNTPEEEEVEV